MQPGDRRRRVRLNNDANQLHLVAADQPDDDEHGLGDDVRADRGDDAVASAAVRRAAPTPRTPAPSTNPTQRAEHEQRARAPASSPSAAQRPAIENGTANTSATQRRRPGRRASRRSVGLTATATAPNGDGQAELAGVEDAVRVERRP